jgi:hypothetical protein
MHTSSKMTDTPKLNYIFVYGNQQLMSPPPIITGRHSIILHLVVNDHRQTITLAKLEEPENAHFMHI